MEGHDDLADCMSAMNAAAATAEEQRRGLRTRQGVELHGLHRAAEEAAEHVRMAQAAASGGTLPAGSTDGYWGAMNTKHLLVDQGNPLVHLWSLGVEEQFYILWPVVVPFIMR